MTSLLEQLADYRPFTAMVIGDFMLDEHVYGAAERLSPDAPVPVLHEARREHHPGGAANVSRCLGALRATVHCVGVVGDDEEGRTLVRALEDAGCGIAGIVVDRGRPTTIKRSLIGLAQHRHPQKMFRVDVESREPLAESVAAHLLAMVDARLDDVDVVCIEDYNKGVCAAPVCRAIIERCRAKGKPVVVDPAAIDDYSRYRGATVITPNRSEAELATGMDTPLDPSELHTAGLAAKLGESLDLEAVVVTLDRHGALLEVRGGAPEVIPTVARSVYDVTGAGDVVLAGIAAGRANGLSWPDCVRFANAAAGLEVSVFGAQPIPFAAVQRELLALHRPLDGKVRTLGELKVEVAAHREAERSIVLTNGCFDVIHAGHIAYLRDAKRQGDVLVVGVNSDEQVRAQKGPNRPVHALADRLEVLNELQSVDYIVSFTEPTAHELIRAVRPDVYVKGGDYRPEEINEHDLVAELGIELRILAHRPGLGSTQAIERLNS